MHAVIGERDEEGWLKNRSNSYRSGAGRRRRRVEEFDHFKTPKMKSVETLAISVRGFGLTVCAPKPVPIISLNTLPRVRLIEPQNNNFERRTK